MAAPTFAAAGTGTSGTGTSAAVPVPSGVAANDLIIIFLFKQNNAAVTAPSGFTALTPQVPATDTAHYVWWKVATGADTGTYSLSWTGSNPYEAVAVRVTGAASSPLDTGAGAPNSAGRASVGTVTPAVSLTTQGPDRLLVWSGANWAGGAWTPPTGYTERYDSAARLSVATTTQTSAGATGSVTGTCATSEYETAWLLAVVPPISGSDTGTGSESGSVTATVIGSDSGTGSESGSASQLVTGSDSGTGTESGSVAIPVSGSDSATGTSTGTIAATTTGSDTGSGTDSGTVAAAVTAAADSGAGTASGFITLPGSDTGTGSAGTAAIAATTTGSDAGTGSDGGYVEAQFGDLVVALFAVDPTTGALTALPDYTKLTLSPQRNGAGSITLEYPDTGLNAALLAAAVTADRDLEVEVWLTGSSAGALRGYLQEASGDDVAALEDPTRTYAGSFLECRLSEAVVYPQSPGSANGNAKQELVFSAATPGAIVATLLAQAQARGTLTDITTGFTSSVDSDGVTWPSVVTTKFSPGASYDQVLAKLVDLGLVEWAVTWTGSARRLDLWIPGNRGVDLTTGLRPIVLRAGRNLVSAPRKWSVRHSATAVLAAGSEGVYQTASDANAVTRRGRRIEASVSASNLSDTGAVQAYAQTQLATVTPGTLEVTHGLGFLPGQPRPVVAFGIGDWAYSQTGTTLDRLRVVQWSLTVDGDQNPSGTVTLNDVMTEALVRLQDQAKALSSGDTVIGTSTSSTDTGVPNPPTSVTASSVAYLVGGSVRSSVLVGWTSPTQNTDGSVITDLAGFTVQYGFGTTPTTWFDAATVNSGSAVSASFTTDPGKTIGIRVLAFDTHGNQSAWSTTANHTTAADASAPATPSTPVVSNYLGVLKIAWDGNTSTGTDMLAAAPDFDHVDVHISTSTGFSPSSSTYFDRLFAEGTVVYTDGIYGTTYYARLVAVDGSGNSSGPSAQASDAPAQVVSADVFDGAIGSAKLADLAVINAKIASLAVNDAKISDLSVGKLTAGTLTAAVTNSGIIRSGTSGQRYELDSASLRFYNSSGTQTVGLTGSGTTSFLTGEFRTALSGSRIVMNPAGSNPDRIDFYPSSGSTFGSIESSVISGEAAVSIFGNRDASSTTSGGMLLVRRSWAALYSGSRDYATVDSEIYTDGITARINSKIVDVAVDTRSAAAGGNRFAMTMFDSNRNKIASTQLNYWATPASEPWLAGVNQDAGLVFGSGIVYSVANVSTTKRNLFCDTLYYYTLTASSSRTRKRDITPITDVDMRQALTKARPMRFRRDDRDEHDVFDADGKQIQHARDAPIEIGLIAEDMPTALQATVTDIDGTTHLGIDQTAMITMMWGHLGDMQRQLDTLQAQVDHPHGGGQPGKP